MPFKIMFFHVTIKNKFDICHFLGPIKLVS